ncbi:winged helix-turn-helix domain-containing protein [Parafrigoribacterium soli]|uniref:winged helix-turn-helix domain-containing protein n=1 Tax=Parafrigoribacterium soli TaxID=3144663 RepID=UPI0032EFE73F
MNGENTVSDVVAMVEMMVTHTPPQVSLAQARRIALAAQGFGRPSPATPGIRQLGSLIRRVGLLQLDSVNVFERSHYLPAFARLGAYDKAELDRLTFAQKGRYIEYWAHEAAVIPVDTWPLLRWRMQDYRERAARNESHWAAANRPMMDWLLAELADKGPLPASAIEHDANRRSGPWWGWSEVKIGLEVLFRWGEVVSGGRTRFERSYALPQQVLSQEVLSRDVPTDEARRRLIAHAASAHGIGTASDLADYFRLKRNEAMPAVLDLVDDGTLVPVTVPGWKQPAYLHRDARMARRIDATALLSPFDPVVWERARAERLFGFHYRIEIYTPQPKRVFGYYVLPLLIDDRLVGRIDLKSDRQNGVLRVQASWSEADAPACTAERLAPLLRQTAAWQGLGEVEVMGRGDLADAVAAELGVSVSAV